MKGAVLLPTPRKHLFGVCICILVYSVLYLCMDSFRGFDLRKGLHGDYEKSIEMCI